MDLLKEEQGTTILETLVVILLLGILVTITTAFYSNIFSNKNMLKADALQLAKQEISKVLSERCISDTIYYNDKKNLKVQRNISQNDLINSVQVTVSKSNPDSVVIGLNAIYKNENSK